VSLDADEERHLKPLPVAVDVVEAQFAEPFELALEAAGCFALVLEAVPAQVAAVVTERLEIPTIGIGAGPATDGQVLVLNDLLGIFEEFKPRFVKRYAYLRSEMIAAVSAFADDVRARRFPADEHCYAIEPDEFARFHASLEDDG
jgi:3-methyl-2-oxobutanoate hydroxymethyltransferase